MECRVVAPYLLIGDWRVEKTHLDVASGIGNVGAALKLNNDRPGAEIAWQSDTTSGVYCANSTPLIVDGTIYGVCCRGGQLRGVDLESGERLWETYAPTSGRRPTGHSTAFLVRNGKRWFLFNEHGELILAHMTPEG